MSDDSADSADSADSTWKTYNQAGAAAPARPRLLRTLDDYFANHAGHAVDLGCGGGRDTRELLARGWRVDAVDSNLASLEMLADLQGVAPSKLSLMGASFEDFSPVESTYDLINASFALPFCHPDKFAEFWRRLVTALKPGGIISCDLFGVNDGWNTPSIGSDDMTFLTRAQIEHLTTDLTMEDLTEKEEDAPVFSGPTKHWHLFTCIARKPLA